jgi:molecular chaperone HscB
MGNLFDKNYFELFGLGKSYSLDRQLLRGRLREMQKKFHPDNFASASEQEKRLSAQYAAHINQAYTTLNDPVKRGQYILSILGISTDDEHDTQMDPEFLIQQMELREELETAKSAGNNAFEALSKLNLRIDIDYSAREKQIAQILDEVASANDAGNADQNLDKARHLVRELQFLNRIRTEIENAEESLI